MTLSDWLVALSLGFGFYATVRWAWATYGPPARAPKGDESVKPKRRSLAFKKRSQGSNVQNAVNAGSKQQDAPPPPVNVPNVQAAPAAPAPPAGNAGQSADGFTLNGRELAQLGEALNLYREGATVEQAVCRAFGVTKGGGEGYRRAKALFDAATVAPGAAPAGTYAAPAAPSRRRAARR